MASCDAYVLPALRREGLPKGVIEAMAYGIPPIVTDSGGSPELVIDKESGLIVPSANAEAIARAVTYLYENPRLREEMGINARERIRMHFRIDDTIKKTYSLYNELIIKWMQWTFKAERIVRDILTDAIAVCGGHTDILR